MVRVRLVHGVLGDVVGTPLAEMVEGFKRDLDPVSELRTWERIALVISDLSRAHVVTQQQKASILSTLLFASTGAPASELFGKAEGLTTELREAAAAASQFSTHATRWRRFAPPLRWLRRRGVTQVYGRPHLERIEAAAGRGSTETGR